MTQERTMRSRPIARGIALLTLAVAAAPSTLAVAGEPLHPQIDRMIAAGTAEYDSLAAPIADDAEFLRRVSLDLTGTIPTSDQARQFLDDHDPDKRTKLIDRLLATPEYARHMQNVFDVILMRRLRQKHVPTAEWQAFLRKSFAENKPWDKITREILSADGSDPKQRGPARFYLDREGEVNELTRDVGRIFLGADLECAQCHNHPEVEDWKQAHYYGLSAFLVRSFVFTDKKKKAVFAEKGVGEVSFESVFKFEDTKTRSTLPRVFDEAVIAERPFPKGQEHKVKPAKNVRPVPKFSRRALLPDAITSSRRFARTGANRLWALMMGRGLVHPVDLDHSDNPPSHPELLELLTDEFAAHDFDIKWFLRELALSKTYQRSSRRLPPAAGGALASAQNRPAAPGGIPYEETFAQAILKPLTPAQFAWAVLQATGEADVHRNALGKNVSEEALHKRLAGYENRFGDLFGGQPGKPPEDFESSVDQVLFLSNDPMIAGLLNSKNGNLADRLLKLPADDPKQIADELYLSALTRPPTAEEIADVEDYLAGRTGDARTVAIQDLIWALIASSEFRFNH